MQERLEGNVSEAEMRSRRKKPGEKNCMWEINDEDGSCGKFIKSVYDSWCNVYIGRFRKEVRAPQVTAV